MSREQSRVASVLLVEDDASLLAAMVECLLREGFLVATAENGAAAMEAARLSQFDAAVIDLFLPDSGGLGVTRALNGRGERAIPVVFITALSNPAVTAALSPLPVLFKPFKRRELLDSIRQVLRRPPPDLDGRTGNDGGVEPRG